MLRRGWTISFTRRVFQGVASGLAAVMFVVFPHIQNVHVVVVCACTILACNSMALGGFQASYVDIGGNNTGLMFCIGNFLATIGGITAFQNGVIANVRNDRKGAIASATSATVGMIYIVLAAGFDDLALWLSLGHGAFRMNQVLRSPSSIADSNDC